MAINFPNSPQIGDTVTQGSRTWQWTGVYWRSISTTIGYTGSTGYTGSQGDGLYVKGSVPTEQDLIDDSTTQIGDAYVVIATGELWIYDGIQYNNVGQFTGYTGSQGYTGSRGESTFAWGASPPENPEVGARWYDTNKGKLVVYLDDGDSLQWVDISAGGFLGRQGYTGSAGNITAAIDSTTSGRFISNNGTDSYWVAGPVMFRNKLINGNFDIWKRSVTQITSGYGSADRWRYTATGSTFVASRGEFDLGQTSVPYNPRYYLRTVVTSVAGAANTVYVEQRVESVMTLSGSSVTLSFWARADSSKPISVNMIQNFGTSGTPSTEVNIAPQKITITDTWTKYTMNFDLPGLFDVGTQERKVLGTDLNDYVSVRFYFDAGSNFDDLTSALGQQSGTFDLAQIQLEEGNQATVFEHRPAHIELSLCQRYYEKWGGTGQYNSFGTGVQRSANVSRCHIPFKCDKRTDNYIAGYSGVITNYTTSGLTVSSINNTWRRSESMMIDFNTSTGTAGHGVTLYLDGSVSAYFYVDGEL